MRTAKRWPDRRMIGVGRRGETGQERPEMRCARGYCGRMRRRLWNCCAAALCWAAVPAISLVGPTAGPALADTATPSAFTALAAPARLADTRSTGAVGASVTISVAVTGDAPLPPIRSIRAPA